MMSSMMTRELGSLRGLVLGLACASVACTGAEDVTTEVALLSGDDGRHCIDWGRVTYENTVVGILDRYCVKCHAPAFSDPLPSLSDSGAAEIVNLPQIPGEVIRGKWALGPQTPELHQWSAVEGYIGRICDRSVDQAGTEGRMPPVGSEAAMEPEDLTALDAWCAAYAAKDEEAQDEAKATARGSEIPVLQITAVERRSRSAPIEVRYLAYDQDSPDATVAIFYDTDDVGFDGEAIAGCLPTSARMTSIDTGAHHLGEQSYRFSDAGLGPGTYFIYACVFDGDTATCDYAESAVSVGTAVEGGSAGLAGALGE